jgi:hypothetical protein
VAQSNDPINPASWNEANSLSTANVIYKHNPPVENPPETRQNQPQASKAAAHSIRAGTSVSAEALRQRLSEWNSPLADYAPQLLESPYWSTVVAICYIEEAKCSINPHGTNNLWGLMASGHLKSYDSLDSGIMAIEAFLAKAESNGRDTVESFRGWYCYQADTADHVCWNWEDVVIRIKNELESL